MTLNLSSNNLKVSWRMCIGGTQSGNTATQLEGFAQQPTAVTTGIQL